MRNLVTFFCRLGKDESGAPATEYALLAALIAIVAAGGMIVLGNGLNTMFSNMGSSISNVSLAPLPSGGTNP